MWLYLFSVCSHWSNGTFPMTHCFPKFATCCCQAREALAWMAVAVNEWDFFFPFSPFDWTLLLMDHLMQFSWEPFLVLLKKTKPKQTPSVAILCLFMWMQNLSGCFLLVNKPSSEYKIHSWKTPSKMCISCYLDTSKISWEQEKQWLHSALTSFEENVQFCMVVSVPQAGSSVRHKLE